MTVKHVCVPVPGSPRRRENAATFAFNSGTACLDSAGPAEQNDSTARCWDMRSLPRCHGLPRSPTARDDAGGPRCPCSVHRLQPRHQRRHVPGYTPPADGPLIVRLRAGTAGHPGLQGHRAGRDQRDVLRSVVERRHLGERRAPTGRRGCSSWTGRGCDQPVPVLQRAAQRVRELLPARPRRGSRSTRSGHRSGIRMPAPDEPLLCNLWPYWYPQRVRGGAGCIGDQYVFPPSFAIAAMDPAAGSACTSTAIWLLKRRGGSTTRGSRSRCATCSSSTAVQLQFFGDDDTSSSSTASGDRSRRRPPAVARQGHVDDGNARPEGGSVYLPCTIRAASANCRSSGAIARRLVPCTGATRSSRSPSRRSTPPARRHLSTAASAPCRWACRRAAPTRSPSSAATATRPSRTSSSR